MSKSPEQIAEAMSTMPNLSSLEFTLRKGWVTITDHKSREIRVYERKPFREGVPYVVKGLFTEYFVRDQRITLTTPYGFKVFLYPEQINDYRRTSGL